MRAVLALLPCLAVRLGELTGCAEVPAPAKGLAGAAYVPPLRTAVFVRAGAGCEIRSSGAWRLYR